MTLIKFPGIPLSDILCFLWNFQIHSASSRAFATQHGLDEPATWEQIDHVLIMPRNGQRAEPYANTKEMCAAMGIKCERRSDGQTGTLYDITAYQTRIPNGAQGVIADAERAFHARCSSQD